MPQLNLTACYFEIAIFLKEFFDCIIQGFTILKSLQKFPYSTKF